MKLIAKILRPCLFIVSFLFNSQLLAASLYDIVKTDGEGNVDYTSDSTELEDISSFYRKVFGAEYDVNFESLVSKYKTSANVGAQRYPYLDEGIQRNLVEPTLILIQVTRQLLKIRSMLMILTSKGRSINMTMLFMVERRLHPNGN